MSFDSNRLLVGRREGERERGEKWFRGQQKETDKAILTGVEVTLKPFYVFMGRGMCFCSSA